METKMYLVAETETFSYLTKGKEYEVLMGNKKDNLMYIRDDFGRVTTCLINGCAHLKGGKWTLITKTM